MADDFDYLVTEQDEGVLQNLGKMAEKLKSLKQAVFEAELQLEAAKKEYDYYSSSVLPLVMHNAGLEEVKLSSGGMLKTKRSFYCSPNKNLQDREIQRDWLVQMGGEHIVKEAAQTQNVQALKDAGIQFTEVLDINTSSLKSFIKNLLGYNGGQSSITIEDIPASFHFSEVVKAEIEL